MNYRKARQRMIDEHISGRGIRDLLVLAAMGKVEREKFVPSHIQEFAYSDRPLPIECEQTISQPYIVALMTEALELKGGEQVLEIGTGSGYAAAVLAEIADQVVSIERMTQLADHARAVLKELNYDNITVVAGDGTKGCAEFAPYDAIVVTAGGPQVPQSLRQQLKVGGRLVMPVGPIESFQTLVRVTRLEQEKFRQEDLCSVRFVPLLGEEGWSEKQHESKSDPHL